MERSVEPWSAPGGSWARQAPGSLSDHQAEGCRPPGSPRSAPAVGPRRAQGGGRGGRRDAACPGHRVRAGRTGGTPANLPAGQRAASGARSPDGGRGSRGRRPQRCPLWQQRRRHGPPSGPPSRPPSCETGPGRTSACVMGQGGTRDGAGLSEAHPRWLQRSASPSEGIMSRLRPLTVQQIVLAKNHTWTTV